MTPNSLLRSVSYCTALLFIMWLCESHFNDSYTANMSFFALFSFLFEMLFSGKIGCGKRFFVYLFCLIVLAVCGVLLVQRAITIEEVENALR